MAKNSSGSENSRIPAHPAQLNKGERKPVTFTLDGKPVEAVEGDSVAAALFANGTRIFTRSFKYHRPRGLLCCSGRCPNCLMNVDGTPNVRTCVTPVQEGMQVRHQNAWPSLEFDALSFSGKIDKLMPVGFYYKTMINPKPLWPVFEHFIRHAAGLGVIDPDAQPEGYHHEYRYTDVAVVGGGPAGMAAALAAAQSGARVTLLDEQDTLGGMLRGDTRTKVQEGPYAGQTGYEVAANLTAQLQAAGVTVWTGAVAFGAYEGHQLGVQRGKTMIELRYKRLVLATGTFDRPAVFTGNDLPGIMLGTAAQRLLRLYGIKPGTRALIATSHDGGLELAEELADAGVKVMAVADTRPASEQGEAARRLAQRDIKLMADTTLEEATGKRHIERVKLQTRGRSPRYVRCDTLCLSLGWEPALALLAQEGFAARLNWDDKRSIFVATEGDDEYIAVGSLTGDVTLDQCLALGAAAGHAAAQNESGKKGGKKKAAADAASVPQPRPHTPSLLATPYTDGKRFVCMCEDTTEKDIAQAVEEGFDDIETLKRYATPSMGPCQGKMCRAAVGDLCSRYNGDSPARVGMSRARPPAQPVTLGALGAGHAAPIRRTSMHHRHIALGAKMLNLGDWKRPEIYSGVEDECRAVRERVGLIDVSTLGKLEFVGKDAVTLLERLYTNKFSDLKVGRVRYGIICDDGGTIIDDGTFSRLDEDRWFLTTTTSGVESIDQTLRQMALPEPGRPGADAHVTNRTAALAAVNLAGPKSREVLAPLTDIDLSPEAFPYLGARQGKVAGVPAFLMRIGFVGELGYEIHFPAEYGAYIWDTLLEAGRQFEIRPFGVEAQRILRLEKQHIIVSHDTDALSNPLDAGMHWIVKWDKEDFAGKTALTHIRDGRPGKQKLVGFTIADVPVTLPEGCQVVQEGRPVGRVTSYRQSPTLGRGIGIAWVPAASAEEGTTIQIAGPEKTLQASVTMKPFYDPEGVRLRS